MIRECARDGALGATQMCKKRAVVDSLPDEMQDIYTKGGPSVRIPHSLFVGWRLGAQLAHST